ncbi:MAG: hypothetical protein IK010_02075 [Bacteroidales bacterium]|nr:hypothetical protein [Bacteroidales bacterium]
MRRFTVYSLRFTRAITLFLLLLASLAAAAQTDLYQRYASQPGVKVASVSNFALDSTAKVDVTVIAAEDDAGWEWMKREFYIGDLAPEQQANLQEGSDVVLFARRSRSNPRENAPIVDENINIAASCYMGISYLSRAVYVFCADTEEQYDAIVALLIKKIMHNSR